MNGVFPSTENTHSNNKTNEVNIDCLQYYLPDLITITDANCTGRKAGQVSETEDRHCLLIVLFSICPFYLQVRLVHTAPEEFENGGFTLKTHQMFSVHTTREEKKMQQSVWICV